MHTLGKGPKETITFSTETEQSDHPRALQPWVPPDTEGDAAICCLYWGRLQGSLHTATHRDSKLPSPTCCKLCNQPSPRSTQEKRQEPSPVALHAPAYMTWFPHQDHNSCKVMRHHAQASIIFDSNHLQTSQRPSVNLLICCTAASLLPTGTFQRTPLSPLFTH